MAATSLPPPPSGNAPETAPVATRVAGRYTLLDQLGAGGMGTVHRARDEASGKVVALKQLQSSLAGERRKTLEALFEREYHTLVRLKHPRIIEVYDYGLTESGRYYTMELLEGDDLHQLSPLPYQQASRCLRDLASSLALIHAHRLLHRDITPRNVRLTPDGRSKLIDFGALTGFGPGQSVVGTPAYTAPEVLRRMPLDQRADLYSLGAAGYFALTGRHAFPATRFEALPELWRKPPLAPSSIVSGIPPALDALILSLLSIDPLARPSSAAAVIDQLTAFAGLPPDDYEHAALSYLSSGRMVGRADELASVRERVARALAGIGAELVIDGAAGVGKTRLLHEVALEAQLRGVVVLKMDAQTAPGFFGVAAALSAQLLAICPEEARREAQPHAGLLGHLGAELHVRLERPTLAELAPNPSERRARFQTALHEWFLAVSAQRTLLLAIDNLHACDDSSAAFLAALGSEARDKRLVILVTQRSGEAVAAPAAVKALRKRSSRLKLSGLTPEACEEFVTSLFGDVANTGRVARLLFDKSGGNPQQCMDLAQLLVTRKIAKYAAGTWVLPLQVSADELPSRMDEFVAIKLADLSAAARALVEALSIHTKPVSIERCLELSENQQGAHTLAALDELLAAQILLVEDGSYRFAQQVVGAAVLAQMDDARRRAWHMRAAETLLSGAGESLALRMEAAWHLLHGGAEHRGADLLASTGRAFLATQFVTESVDQIVQALRTAVEIYERQSRSDYELAGLLFPLVPLGYYSSDWHVTTRYALRAFQLGLKITGLGLAHKLRPLLGKRLALWLGRSLAGIRIRRQQKRGLDYDLRTAIGSFTAMVPATMGTLCTCVDVRGATQLANTLEPLELLDFDPFASLMRDWSQAQWLTVTGCERESLAMYRRVCARLRDPQIAAVTGESHRKTMYGGSLFSQAMLECHCSSPRALELAREMEELGVRIWAMTADQVRLLHHAYRGELELVQHYRERVERFATQGSSTWQSEMFWPAVLLDADMLSGDTIAARRTFEQLVRRAEDVPSLRAYADAAHAAYLTLRGEFGSAIELYETLLPALPPRQSMSWLTTRSYFARALNLAGQHARAKQVALDALAATQPEDAIIAMHMVELRRQLALAEAGLGHGEEALRLLDELFATYGALDNPLLIGLLHKARAEIALRDGDYATFDTHLGSMEQRFRPTNNPALIAQWERLAKQAVRAGLRRSIYPDDDRNTSSPLESMERTIGDLAAALDPGDYALQLFVQRTQARSGYLYLCSGSTLHLAAATVSHEPPPGLETQLRERVFAYGQDDGANAAQESGPAEQETMESSALDGATDAGSVLLLTDSRMQAPAPSYREDRYCVLLLHTVRAGKRVAVGGVILELEADDPLRLRPKLLAAVATALYDHYSTIGAASIA